MAEMNVIDDVRVAKRELDAQATTMEELARILHDIEDAYNTRTGEFASLPLTRPEWVEKAIAGAALEPGSALLNDSRPK